jgi:hypothetical protein
MQTQYIADEVKDKSNQEMDTSSWHKETVRDIIPLQQNGYGLFIPMTFLWNHVPNQ